MKRRADLPLVQSPFDGAGIDASNKVRLQMTHQVPHPVETGQRQEARHRAPARTGLRQPNVGQRGRASVRHVQRLPRHSQRCRVQLGEHALDAVSQHVQVLDGFHRFR